jgi:hypothetical protein
VISETDDDQEADIVGDGGSSYEVDTEAGVGAGGPASGLVSQRPQTLVLKTKKRADAGAGDAGAGDDADVENEARVFYGLRWSRADVATLASCTAVRNI